MYPFSIKPNFACVMLPAIKCEGIKCVTAMKGGDQISIHCKQQNMLGCKNEILDEIVIMR